MNKCVGLWGWLFGHKFQARFNEEESDGKWPFKEGTLESQMTTAVQGGYDVSVSSIVNSTKSHKSSYVLDVCERCGEIIKHDEPKDMGK